jgi:hypothetical protein
MRRKEVVMVSRVRCFWLSLGVAMLITVFSGSYALAVGNLRLGLLEINPEVTLRGGYDDNVFLEHEDEKEDTFGVVTPGINFLLEKDSHYINLGYKVDIIRYDDYSSQDSENHTVYGKLECTFPGALFIKLDEIYQDTSDYATSEFVDRVDRKQNNGDASIGFMFSDDFTLQLDYLSEYHEYDPTELQDLNRFAQEFGPAIYVRVWPKTSAIVEYHYGIIDYYDVEADLNDNSSTFHQLMGGLKWEATGKSTGTLKAGYQWRDYDEDKTLEDGQEVTKNDKDTWVVSGEIEVNFTPKTSAQLILKRAIVESSFTDNEYYTENLASIAMTQKVLDKVAINLGFSFYKNYYHTETMDFEAGEEIKRKDEIFDAKIGVEYKIQDWFIVGVDFKHQTRDSNSTIHDYRDNQSTAYLTLAF